MKIPSKEQVIWAAGFFDGEGHVRVSARITKSGQGTNLCPDLCVAQKRLEPLLRLQGPFEAGAISPPAQHSGVSYWRVHGFEKVQAIMASLWAWLSPHKREQFARVFIEMRAYNDEIRAAKNGIRVRHPGWKGRPR